MFYDQQKIIKETFSYTISEMNRKNLVFFSITCIRVMGIL